MKKFTVRMSVVGTLAALASFGMSTAANATDTTTTGTTDTSSCTTSTDSNGNTVQNCAVVGEDEFHVNEHFGNQESLILDQHGVTWLTIQVHHMTPQQIVGQCKILPIGTPFWNGFTNPVTGVVKYKLWHVTSGPGENKFCLGHDGLWHKFNCNNPVKGAPFGTPPPPPKQRLKASVKTGDYVTWHARKKLTASKHIGGSLDVRSQDNTCHAHVDLDNRVRIVDWMSVTFRSRNIVQARTDAVNAVTIKAGSNQHLHGKLSQKASIFINAKISASCTTQPPSDTTPAPYVTLNTLNQTIETKSATTDSSVTVYGGDTATVKVSALYGQIYTDQTFNNVSGSWTTTIGYTAPGEIPDGTQSFNDPDAPPPPAGFDQVRVVVVDNQTGKRVVAYTNVKITPLNPAPKEA